MITDEQLEEWRRLADAATPGPYDEFRTPTRGDLALRAAAREAVPALIAEVERLRGSHCPHCKYDVEEHYCIGIE